MPSHLGTIVLGSRSPRRRELLGTIVAADRMRVVLPRSEQEAGFEGAETWPEIEERLLAIARGKCDDVLDQLRGSSAEDVTAVAAVIAADTVIVACDAAGRLTVLGQPSESTWEDEVRKWFHAFYLGKTHTAATAVCVAAPAGRRIERVVRTEVTFRANGGRWVEWYLSTGEPRGKAGGYAIQEAGSVFVERIEGSLSNVVGLPLEVVLEAFAELSVHVP